MHEFICFDPAWEALNRDPSPANEDEWWDRHCEEEAAAEADAMTYAEEMAELYEFDSDEEREAYIQETYNRKMEEYECRNR